MQFNQRSILHSLTPSSTANISSLTQRVYMEITCIRYATWHTKPWTCQSRPGRQPRPHLSECWLLQHNRNDFNKLYKQHWRRPVM